MSVKRKVTTPEGGTPADTRTGCHSKLIATQQTPTQFANSDKTLGSVLVPVPDTFGMSVNEQPAASRQFVASSPPMSTQMNAFATGKGRYLVQAAMFALMLVVVASAVTRRSEGFTIAVGGFVLLSIFALAGTALRVVAFAPKGPHRRHQ